MFKKCFIFGVLTACVVHLCAAKVLIITHSYNRPDFIEIQSVMFKRFMQDEYEFVVFSDARDLGVDKEIKETCIRSGVTYMRIPQEIHARPYLKREPGDPLHRPNIRHANVVQYSMDVLGFNHDGPVLVLDSDMFLVRPLSVVAELQDYHIAACMRGTEPNIDYLWPGFMIFAMDRLPNKRTLNFNCGRVNGASVDSGGHTHYYLKNNAQLKLKKVEEHFGGYELFCPDRHMPMNAIDKVVPVAQQLEKLKKLGFNEKEIKFLQKKPDTIEFLCKNSFFHYRAATNYDNQSVSYDKQKMALIREFFQDILV